MEFTYNPQIMPDDNLLALIGAQNADGNDSAVYNGQEPFAVLAAKAIVNASVSVSGGEVTGPASSVNTGIVVFSGTTGSVLNTSALSINSGGNVSGFATGNGLTLHGGATVLAASGVVTITAAGGSTTGQIVLAGGSVSTASNLRVVITGTNTATSGTNATLSITPTYNQASGTAVNTDLKINRTQTAVGSGAQLLIDAQVSTVSQFSVSNTGVVTVCAATAVPAAGSTSARLLFGTTAGFGIYYGSNAPTVSAAQGSIYLRSDGSSSSSRVYVNSTGSTTWVAITTAS